MSEALTLSEALPEGYRMTELGPLPEEWRVVRLGEILHPVPRKFRRVQIQNAKEYTLLSVGLYGKGVSVKEKVRGDALRTKAWYQVKKGDFLLLKIWARKGSYGFLKEAIENAVVSGDYPILSLDRTQAEENFLELYLSQQKVWQFLAVGAKGATNRQRVHERDFIEIIKVSLPPLPEQRAIAHVLRAVQRAKEATEEVIAAARELKKSLMRHLFTYGPVPVDRADAVEMQETEIGLLPAHWRVVKLGEVVHKTRQIDPRKSPTQRFKYIDVSSASKDQLAIVGYQTIHGKNAPSRARKQIEAGDVIFATVRPYLKRIAKVTPEFDKQICSTAFCVLRPRSDAIDSDFLFYAVSYDPFVERVAGHQRGSSYPAVTDKDVLREPIPLPPLDEQREIARMLQVVDEKIRAEEARKAALEALFKTLLHDLMTAKRRLPAEFVARFKEGSLNE